MRSEAQPELAEWMKTNTRFPNSMVDRITPVTTPDVIENLASEFGVEDEWPVAAEPFTAWVLDDHFSDGRPQYEDVGVLLVEDVTPYELMKLRLLNAGHQALCYFAYLAGYRLVADAAGDPLFAEFLLEYMDSEATPTLLPVPGIDLPEFKQTAIDRFANPAVRDTIVRLCFGSSDRIPKWLLPVDQGEPAQRRARSGCPRPPSPAGRGTPRASTSRANRSTYRINSPIPLSPWPSRSWRTRPPSSRTPRCSATSPSSHASSRPTCGHWTPCTATVPARRSKR